MEFLLVILLFLVFAVVLHSIRFWLFQLQLKKVTEQFEKIAKSLHLKLHVSKHRNFNISFTLPTIYGKIANSQFQMYMYRKGRGKQRHFMTKFRLQLDKTHSHSFVIYREDFFSKIGKFIGKQDIEIGCPEFDDFFIIRSSNSDFMKTVLVEQIREAFQNIHVELEGRFYLEGDDLSYEEESIIDSSYDRRRFFNLILVASILSDRINLLQDKLLNNDFLKKH